MNIVRSYASLAKKLNDWRSLPLLLMRLTLAYGFYQPAKMKWSNMDSIIDWFRSLHIPLPAFNAYLSATTEVAGIVLLTLGLFTRFISIPLIIVMIVAIVTVHWGNGFDAGDNGFEIPLYYILMLLMLIFSGGGKFSLDYLLWRNRFN